MSGGAIQNGSAGYEIRMQVGVDVCHDDIKIAPRITAIVLPCTARAHADAREDADASTHQPHVFRPPVRGRDQIELSITIDVSHRQRNRLWRQFEREFAKHKLTVAQTREDVNA